MNNRMLKDLEIIEVLQEARRRAENVHGYSAIDKINEAISLLSAEPEPCEEVLAEAEQSFDDYKNICRDYSDICPKYGQGDNALRAAAYIDGYLASSRQVQEAIKAERHRCANTLATFASGRGGAVRKAIEYCIDSILKEVVS